MLDSLNVQTALLEALSWDEEALEGFNKYFNEQIQAVTPPGILLDNIKIVYGEQAATIIKSLFKEIYIEHGLYLKPLGDNDEH